MNTSQLDPRIGQLSSGKFYAFAHGYDQPETTGTLQEVEKALGIATVRITNAVESLQTYDVVMHFAHPAWDEVDGIQYSGIRARSKSQANQQARRQAERDGHAIGGRGRYTFTATEVAAKSPMFQLLVAVDKQGTIQKNDN